MSYSRKRVSRLRFKYSSGYDALETQREQKNRRGKMTKLLEKAFTEASKLPKVEQNALAKWLLNELETERKWDNLFADSESVLDQLADEAIEEQRQGKTKALDISQL